MQRKDMPIKSFMKRKWKMVLAVFALAGLLVFFTTISLAPVHKFRELQQLVRADSVFMEEFAGIYHHKELDSLLRELAFKEALLKLSESDSIQLVVNLSDSTVGLSIKGVPIHETRISEFSKDRFLKKLPLILEIKLLSRPLPVFSQYATIVKEPVVVRHAPKDEEEAALNAWQPDSLVQNPAFAVFNTGFDIQIIFEQDRNERFRDRWKKFAFYSHLRTGKVLASVKNFFLFSGQQYQPSITIEMPVDDLRAIYRALPESALIVLKL
jgi:hypothetical protein